MADSSAAPAMEPECKCPPKGAPKWVVTFGDMMSLLLTFFVLLLSFSTTDIIKYKQLVGSIKDAFGVAETEPSFEVPNAQNTILPQIQLPQTLATLAAVRAEAARIAKTSSELTMESGAEWVRIKVDGDALFDSGAFEIKPEAAPILGEIGELINDFEGTVLIEGHTDGSPPRTTRFTPGSYLGNYELGALRAIAVMGWMVSNKSTDPLKMVPLTYGELRPRETNELEAGRAKNRRVEFEFRASSGANNEVGGRVLGPED